MKDLKNLKGAKMLSKNEQKEIKGGAPGYPCGQITCPSHLCCFNGVYCGICPDYD